MLKRMRNGLPGGRVALLALLAASEVFAGQSLVLTPGNPVTVADPFYPKNQSYRVEFQMHSWTLPASGAPPVIYLAGTGFAAYLTSGAVLALESLGDRVVEGQPCFLNIAGMTNALVRFQRNVSTMQVTCEVWSYDGTGYNTQKDTIGTLGNLTFGGGTLGGALSASLGFLRVTSTLVPVGGKPPVTADRGDWTELDFDGNMNDSSGKGHGGSGAVTYAATPNQVPISFPKTAGAPYWSNWTSLRAGFPATLDGTASYSLADGSSAVSAFWQQLSGPTTVVWQGRESLTPTITGLIFGSYTFQLQVTDVAGSTATTTLEVGAVATDANGVVVQANPDADALFGPMIAFGKNPWSYADERNLKMELLQKNTYATPPTWASPAENATVSYTYFDPIVAPAKTTLAAGITATATAIPIGASTLDLSTFPTEILVGNGANWEIVRICSQSGSTLNVCFDGRGFHYGVNNSYVLPASAWPTGTKVWQAKVKGTGTHFLSTMCAYGPGVPVAANVPINSAGTIAVTPGSAAGTGNGTGWNGPLGGRAIVIFGTHGGAPFTFFSYVNSVSGNAITFARPFPADADAGSYSYNIFSDQRNFILHYQRADGTDGYVYFLTAGCETDTDGYLYMGWDNAYANQAVAGASYSYMDGFGYTGDFSPNFYDIGLAHYAFYFRSGYRQALTSARNVEDYWLRYPENAQGDAGGAPRNRSITGVVAAAVLDGDRASNWSGLRTYAQWGLRVAQQSSCDDDLRETAYAMSWLAMAARFDPDPAQRANWQSGVAGASYARDNRCKGADNSFASAFYWNPGPLQLAATQGSTTVTALNGTFPSNMCYSTAHGTAAASSGSALLTALTGAFVPPAGSFKLLVGGTMGGVPYNLVTQFDYNSPSSMTMAALWPGDSGTVYWSIENNDFLNYALTIAQGPGDTANFGQITSCTLIDSTHIQLYRPWTSAGGTFAYTLYNLVGRGTQPFMAGIKALQMRIAGQTYAPYQALDQAIASWVGTTGFDPATKGIFYGRGFPMCEPVATESGITDVQYRTIGCIENSYNGPAATQARARNAEAQNAMSVMYLGNPTEANRNLGDLFYGAAYGAPGLTASGYFSDGITASNLDDIAMSIYKWPGFFFGIGMAHQWPAVRVGGVAPAQNRTVYVSLDPGVAANAAILVTAPSGAQATYQCGNTSPCAVTVDDRQGTHWYQIRYLSSTGDVVSQTDPDLLSGPSAQ